MQNHKTIIDQSLDTIRAQGYGPSRTCVLYHVYRTIIEEGEDKALGCLNNYVNPKATLRNIKRDLRRIGLPV